MRIFLLTFLTVCVFRVSAAPETPFRHGRLDNGLTYYIRATGASAGKADFYLVQNVGALMEEDHQNGLAHVLEHMAFHATEHFPEGVPAFLKRRGIQDLNAYTGADETVYHIDGVPTTDSGLVDSCLLILHDWSGFLQLRADEMEIERKVILEERRQGMDLSQRMQSQLNAYLYNHSKYATHDVIGTPEVLNHFTADEVRAYYHDFYRPDQHQKIENQLSYIRPYLRDCRRIGINGRRAGCKQGEDDAGQHDNGSLQTHGGIGFQKAFAHLLTRFPRKGRKGDRSNSRVDIQAKKAAIYREDHDKRQDRDKKAPNQCHRPKRDALPKAAAFNGGHDLGGEHRLLRCTHSGCRHDGGNDPLHDGEQGHHQFQTVCHNAFCQSKTDKQL